MNRRRRMAMHSLEACVHVEVGGTSDVVQMKSAAYSILCDMTSFPKYMPNVLEVTEKTLSSNTSLVEWRCTIEGAPFVWTQENTYDADNYTVRYRLVAGDFDSLEGCWKIEQSREGLALKLVVSYALDLPVIEDVLGPVLREKLQSNSLQMLSHIKERLVSLS
jgi:ribosome-associated toxin RatA of RatAB toxin-antitoxin module